MSKMKVLNLHGVGELRYEEIPIPEVKKDEVLLKVKCAGICGSDIGRIFKTGTYHFPTVPGHEFAGEVVYSEKSEELGLRASVYPLIPCFSCKSCSEEKYATCSDYDYYGSRRNGGFSEYIAVKRWNLITLPDQVGFDEGAMCEPASVARHASQKIMCDKPETVLISGAGPIGLIAAQWCMAAGTKKVYFFDIDKRKTEFAKTLGFYEYNKETVDAVIEGTGAGEAIQRCLEAVKSYGRIVLMGNPADDILLKKESYWKILRKEIKLSGTWNSSYSQTENDWRETVNAIAVGKISLKPLISHRFSLNMYEKAFNIMKYKTEFYNKILFEVGD